MLKVLTTILLFITVTSFQSFGQDSLKSTKKLELFPKSYGDKKWNLLIGLDARRSYFAGTKIKIGGIKIGAIYKGVHRFGIGFYQLNKNLVFHDVVVGKANQDLVDKEIRFSLGYSSIFYERVFFKTRWWDVSFPVHLGGGSITGTYKDTLGAYPQFVSQGFSALLPSVQVKFYPLTWLAFRVSGGYRIAFNTQPEIKRAFRTAFYGFGLSINPIELYKSIFKKNNSDKNSSEQEKEILEGEEEERR
ncbi:MAG: hypothetical protein R2780_04150 [Crocinitomicaceae bacterium]